MKKLYLRFKAETPGFYRRVQVFGLSLSGLATGLVKLEGFPASFTDLAGHFKFAGLALVLFAQCAVKNTDVLTTKPPVPETPLPETTLPAA